MRKTMKRVLLMNVQVYRASYRNCQPVRFHRCSFVRADATCTKMCHVYVE